MSDQPASRANSKANHALPLPDNAGQQNGARMVQGRSKTDLRFWRERIFKPVWRRSDGVKVESANFAVGISFRGRRIKWSLDTPNRDAAAMRAKEIYLSLQASGWEETLRLYRPQEAPEPEGNEITVGEYLNKVHASGRLSKRTYADYAKALRHLATSIAGAPDSSRKHDKCHGGREEWLAAADAVKLALFTTDALESWRRGFLGAGKPDPISQRSRRVTVNSYLRRCKCLFAKELIGHLDVVLPDPVPFSQARFEKRVSNKYRSNFDIRALVALAREELAGTGKHELFKIFVLAAMVGLRRREIDLLPWTAFHFDQGSLRIEATEFFQPKTEESSGELPLEPELISLFRGYHARARGPFVIENPHEPAPQTAYQSYRCGTEFRALAEWLRLHGVDTDRPLHALRKEFGSLINRTYGIHAASVALRHASIGITSQVYATAGSAPPAGWAPCLSSPLITFCRFPRSPRPRRQSALSVKARGQKAPPMAPERSSVEICRWPGGWCLVGDGPSYLLFGHTQMEVTHLSIGLHRELRDALKGYAAIQAGELAPLVEALGLAGPDWIYDPDSLSSRSNDSSRQWAAFVILREIQRLLRLFPKRATFEKELRRFCTSLRAAGQYAMYHTAPGVPESSGPPASFFAHDRYGQRVWVSPDPQVAYRCEPDSKIAECAQKVWRQEQDGFDGASVLYRIPTRKDIREHLNVVEARVTKLCRAEGFNWLPRATRQ